MIANVDPLDLPELTLEEIEAIDHAVSEAEQRTPPKADQARNPTSYVDTPVREVRKGKAKSLQSIGRSDLGQLLAGKPGRYSLVIPPRIAQKNGQYAYLDGGTLLVKSDGQRIFPLNAAGRFQNRIKKAKALGVYLQISSLSNDKPPRLKNVPHDVFEMVDLFRLLWHLVTQAIAAWRAAQGATCSS